MKKITNEHLLKYFHNCVSYFAAEIKNILMHMMLYGGTYIYNIILILRGKKILIANSLKDKLIVFIFLLEKIISLI